MAKINITGLGKLGFPMACFLSKYNKEINIFDINKKLTNIIKNNPNKYLPNELNLKKYIKYKNNFKIFYDYKDSIKNTEICFITVPTPSKKNGEFSNNFILKILEKLSILIKKGETTLPYLININSTVMPGSFEKVFIPFMNKKKLILNKDYLFCYNPYFVALGNVIKNLEKPDFILVGASSKFAANKLIKFYKKIYNKPIFKVMSLSEAELVKLLINCYLTMKISYTNFIKDISEKNKLNSENILNSVGSDKRVGNHFFKYSIPFAGPCLPRDVDALEYFCKKNKINSTIPNLSKKINQIAFTKYYKILKFLKVNKINKIGFLGTSYKSNTNYNDDSIARKLMQEAKKNKMKVFYYDKYVEEIRGYTTVLSINAIIKKSDVIFISYYDNEFLKINKNVLSKIYIWDIFNLFDNKSIKTFSTLEKIKSLVKANHINLA
jgi:UDPglucose 6-dehydrogenase